jgi:hypothetical protein
MQGDHWKHRCCQMMGMTIVATSLQWGTAHGQACRPSNEDVDIAIRMCTLGERTDAKVEGGLNLLKRRLLSGEGSLSYSEIPSVIGSGPVTDTAKIQLFERMQSCVVAQLCGPPLPRPLQPTPSTTDAMPRSEQQHASSPAGSDRGPRDPKYVNMADRATRPGAEVALEKCTKKGDIIRCNLALTRRGPGMAAFQAGAARTVLWDDFKIPHPQVNAYFLNGRGERQQSVQLGPDDWIWLELEYSGAKSDITQARLQCDVGSGWEWSLHGPVETAQ